MKANLITVLVTGAWIGFSEFLRNELLFKNYWVDHYEGMGLVFPSTMVNNMIWALWSFALAGLILFMTKRMTTTETVIVSWIFAFFLMWLVTGNLNVLPLSLLIFAVPLSWLEIIIAVVICKRLGDGSHG